MKGRLGRGVALPSGIRRLLPVALLAVAALVAAVPTGFGISTGITKDNAGVPDFEALGCTACHGAGAPHATFAEGSLGQISWTIADAKGKTPAGNAYHADHEYTINITLKEQNAPEAAKHAGFNLRASAGKLAGVAGVSQVSSDGTQATHVAPDRHEWQVLWTSPAEGPVVFDLFVNDVDGSGLPDAGDEVHRVGWFLTDESHAQPGAVSEEEIEFGITLQQYWIGLIGLAGMIFVIVASFVYLKFVNPHNSGPKDR